MKQTRLALIVVACLLSGFVCMAQNTIVEGFMFHDMSEYLVGQTTFERIIPIEGGAVELPGPECVVAGDDGYIINVPLGGRQNQCDRSDFAIDYG